MRSLLFHSIVLCISLVSMIFALQVGLKKEADRMDMVREHNCTNYGQHINETYGREVCPPTPRG